MKRSKYFLMSAIVTSIGYSTHSFLNMSTYEVGAMVVSAVAAPLVGMVLFDFKAFSLAAALTANTILSRLGHRTYGTGSL